METWNSLYMMSKLKWLRPIMVCGPQKIIRKHDQTLANSPRRNGTGCGSGTGSNLRLLQGLKFPRVTGVDLNEGAIRYCAEENLGLARQADTFYNRARIPGALRASG